MDVSFPWLNQTNFNGGRHRLCKSRIAFGAMGIHGRVIEVLPKIPSHRPMPLPPTPRFLQEGALGIALLFEVSFAHHLFPS
jgi:hypothetical protein